MLGAKKIGLPKTMPSGLTSMAKMFGIDPQEILTQAKRLGDGVNELVQTMQRVESKIDRIAVHLGIEEEKNVECVSIADRTGTGTNGR